jgi:hypothetical protein
MGSNESSVQSYRGHDLGTGNWRKECQVTAEQEKCVEYPFGFDVRFAGRTGEEWSEFGVLNAPMDRYSTVDYYFWLEHSFEFEHVELKYDLLPGYRAGIEDYSVKAIQDIPSDLSKDVPTGVSHVYHLRIVIVRDRASFFPLVLYGTLPLFILYYVGVITLMTFPRREDRLKTYVGALFATFAYFLSLRQLLQTPVSWIELLAMTGMVLWIVLEAATIAFPTKPDKTSNTGGSVGCALNQGHRNMSHVVWSSGPFAARMRVPRFTGVH